MKVTSIDFEKLNKTLIVDIDCTKEYDKENYFEIGKSTVINSNIGSFREASKTPHSRFGYRFTLKNKQKPHLLVLEYPDNAERFMCIQNGTSYDNTTAITCGGNYKLTNEMQKVYSVFWPRWTDDSLVFTSCNLPIEAPVAIKSIKIYQLESLPEAKLPKECLKDGNRTFGVQYEDPCNVGNSEGAFEYTDWIERNIEYMKMTGQNRLIYPINWYHGPIVPVKSQPNSRFNTLVMEDRKMYMRSSFNYGDWLEDLLTKFDKEGLTFTGSLTLMRLGNLFKKWNIDKESIINGKDTINNVLFNGEVQTAVNDWTAIFNPIMFEKWVNRKGPAYAPFDEYAYGEKFTNAYKTPLFNALHPEVERQLIEYFEELGSRYGHHKSLSGFQINFWHGTILWFANLLAGYDDYSFTLFEKETGINSNIDIKDGERFKKRYEFMINSCKEEFVNWRCKKVFELLIKVKNAIRIKNKNLKLGVTIWNETSYPAYLHSHAYQSDITQELKQFGNRCSNYELYKEGGLDLTLFDNEEGIELSVEHCSARGREKRLEGLEISSYLEDYAYLDSEVKDKLLKAKNSVGFHFDCWTELWGNHVKFSVDKDDKNLETIKKFKDYSYEYIFHENSLYDDETKDKFFFPYQIRIASPFPSGDGYLEEMTLDLACHDALSFTSGGLYLNKAHARIQLEFAKEYRKLPAVKFSDYKNVGAVTSRYYFDGEKTYIYAVNREPFDNLVEIHLPNEVLKENISPFMLKVWILDGERTPCKAVANFSSKVKAEYAEKANEIIKLLDSSDKTKSWAKGIDIIKDRLIASINEEKFHEVRHLSRCYIVQKAQSEKNKK